SATARRRCTRTTSPPTCASSRPPRSWPASSFRPYDRTAHGAPPGACRTAEMRIAVLGVGLIGGSIGLAAKEHVEDAEVVGFGRDLERLQGALDRGAIDRVAGSVEEAVGGAQLCFACAPVGALPELVGTALEASGPDTLVTDVGSTKEDLVSRTPDPRFVGGHPIAGAETAGVEHARADLFQAPS